MASGKERLFSLDALRGLDMLFLCVVQPLLASEQVRSVYDFDDTPARHYAWRNEIADILECKR